MTDLQLDFKVVKRKRKTNKIIKEDITSPCVSYYFSNGHGLVPIKDVIK